MLTSGALLISGCSVGPEEMVAYLKPFLSFTVLPNDLELVGTHRIADSIYWLWVFYENAKHRWNLIVISKPNGWTQMCVWYGLEP